MTQTVGIRRRRSAKRRLNEFPLCFWLANSPFLLQLAIRAVQLCNTLSRNARIRSQQMQQQQQATSNGAAGNTDDEFSAGRKHTNGAVVYDKVSENFLYLTGCLRVINVVKCGYVVGD